MGSWGVLRAAACTVFLAGGCGRIGFDVGTSIQDASGDGASDAPDAPAFGPWMTPIEITVMNTGSMEFGPTFSPDANEVFVASRSTGDAEIYRYRRENATAPFSTGVVMAALNLAVEEDGEPSLSDDGLTIYFNRYAPDRIFTSTRSSTSLADWSAPVLVAQPELAGFHSPDFAGDLRMVVTSSSFVWESTRSSTSMPWSEPVSLGIVGEVPCMRRDGLELLWEATVEIDGNTTSAIFRATRSSVIDAFGPAERLSFGALDVAGVGDPELSHDGRTLIFSAEEVPERGTYDIYISERAVE